MVKLILLAVTAYKAVAELVRQVWKKRGDTNVQTQKIERQLQEVRKEMWDALLNGDYARHGRLNARREWLLKKLSSLHR